MPKIANTPQFMQLARLAEKQQLNRRVNTEEISHELDPVGTHLVYTHAMVNDYTIRTWWYIKVRNSDQPKEVELDVPIGYFNRLCDTPWPGASLVGTQKRTVISTIATTSLGGHHLTTPSGWSYEGESVNWQGRIYRNGIRVWVCTHQHLTKSEASKCAGSKLRELKEREGRNDNRTGRAQ